MEHYQALLSTLALTLGVSWASGINLYAALLVLGLGGATGNIALPESLQVLTDPMIIGAAAVMYFVEFVADKTPGVDTGWDAIHTFIRIPAGAMLAAGAVGEVTPALEIAAGILGGGMAATSHATKSGARMVINTSPEPFSNWIASISEDLLVLGGLWTALNHPLLFLLLLILFIAVTIWLLPKIYRLLKVIVKKIASWLGFRQAVESANKSANKSADEADDTDGGIGTVADQPVKELERLAQLRRDGLLTEDEFSAAKRKLIDSF